MFGLRPRKAQLPEPKGPVLDLSGPKLRRAFEHLLSAAENTGGIERYVGALALKSSLFEEVLGRGKILEMTETEFLDIAAFIAPARRRVGGWLAENGFRKLQVRLAALMEGWSDVSTADARLSAFENSFPANRANRWVRDLAAEALHFTAPEHYPLMTRWIWDARVGTGVLREIWFADDPDTARIEAGDDFQVHASLRAELETFLRDNGVFRDLPFYADILCAHVYADYINDRGGQYLRADACGDSPTDGMLHTRRMLGLDAVDSESGRTRLKLMDGQAHVLGATPPGEQLRLNSVRPNHANS
jgi:hypothetical protein